MNPPNKKLPSVEEINRLYWFEEMSLNEIALKYGVRKPAVSRYMRYHKIPMRKMGRPARRECVCIVKGCKETVCLYKRPVVRVGVPKVWVWKMASRCLRHYIEYHRCISRNAYRKKRGTTPDKYRKSWKVEIGKGWLGWCREVD